MTGIEGRSISVIRLSPTGQPTGETFQISGFTDIHFEPDDPDDPNNEEVDRALSAAFQRQTLQIELLNPPDPALLALVTGDPWVDVTCRQHQTLAALKAMRR